MSLLALVSS